MIQSKGTCKAGVGVHSDCQMQTELSNAHYVLTVRVLLSCSQLPCPTQLCHTRTKVCRQCINDRHHTWKRTWSTTMSLSRATVCRLLLEKSYEKLPIFVGGTACRCSTAGSQLPGFLASLYAADSHPTCRSDATAHEQGPVLCLQPSQELPPPKVRSPASSKASRNRAVRPASTVLDTGLYRIFRVT